MTYTSLWNTILLGVSKKILLLCCGKKKPATITTKKQNIFILGFNISKSFHGYLLKSILKLTKLFFFILCGKNVIRLAKNKKYTKQN